MHRHTGLEILSGGREYARLAPKLRELPRGVRGHATLGNFPVF